MTHLGSEAKGNRESMSSSYRTVKDEPNFIRWDALPLLSRGYGHAYVRADGTENKSENTGLLSSGEDGDGTLVITKREPQQSTGGGSNAQADQRSAPGLALADARLQFRNVQPWKHNRRFVMGRI